MIENLVRAVAARLNNSNTLTEVVEAVVAELERPGSMSTPTDPRAMADVVLPDGTHRYWSTHCRHGNHNACAATELAPGVPRRPAQCKTCAAPCVCPCHKRGD